MDRPVNDNNVVIQHNGGSYIKYEEYEKWLRINDDTEKAYERLKKEVEEEKLRRDHDDGLKFFCLTICVPFIWLLVDRSQYVLAVFPAIVTLALSFSLFKYTNIFK